MLRLLLAMLLAACLAGCRKHQIEVQSDTRWSGTVNQASVYGEGSCTYELWETAPTFTFSKETEQGYLGVRFKQGKGDEPETTAPYGTIWGSAW